MTTLNARANQAFHALVEKHGEDWFGFDHQRDAFEEGWETGYKAACVEIAEAITKVRDSSPSADRAWDDGMAAAWQIAARLSEVTTDE